LRDTLDSGARRTFSDRGTLLSLRHKNALVGLQVQHAKNLCQGWAQLQMSEGYTDQGRPLLPPSAPQASYEV
jgi:hypothetical protein